MFAHDNPSVQSTVNNGAVLTKNLKTNKYKLLRYMK